MMFESNREQEELVQDVTRNLRTYGGQPEDEEGVGGEVPDEVAKESPSYGHSGGWGSSKASDEVTEGFGALEGKLCVLLEVELAQQERMIIPTAGKPVPTTGIEGTSSKKEEPDEIDTPNAAAQHAAKGRVGGDIEKSAEEELEQMKTDKAETDETGQDEPGSEEGTV